MTDCPIVPDPDSLSGTRTTASCLMFKSFKHLLSFPSVCKFFIYIEYLNPLHSIQRLLKIKKANIYIILMFHWSLALGLHYSNSVSRSTSLSELKTDFAQVNVLSFFIFYLSRPLHYFLCMTNEAYFSQVTKLHCTTFL